MVRYGRTLRCASALLFLFGSALCAAAQKPTDCPVVPTLASSKTGEQNGYILIWYFNQSRKAIRGAQFDVSLLDGVANRFPGYGPYIATGTLRPNQGDFVGYPNKREADNLGDRWALIEGIAVRVTRVLFDDGTVWVPQKGQTCEGSFMNDKFQAEWDRRWEEATSEANRHVDDTHHAHVSTTPASQSEIRQPSSPPPTTQSNQPQATDMNPSYVWIAEFDNEGRAQDTSRKIQGIGLASVVVPRAANNGQQVFVVLAGPFSAGRIPSVIDWLKTQGFPDSREVKPPNVHPTP